MPPTPIPALRVIDRNGLWARVLVGSLVGMFLGVMIAQVPAESENERPVGITPVIVTVGAYLCQGNEGLKTVFRHGRLSHVYSFQCKNQAEFNEIPITQRPIPTHKIVPQEDAPPD